MRQAYMNTGLRPARSEPLTPSAYPTQEGAGQSDLSQKWASFFNTSFLI